jgi:hypothetical protein
MDKTFVPSLEVCVNEVCAKFLASRVSDDIDFIALSRNGLIGDLDDIVLDNQPINLSSNGPR